MGDWIQQMNQTTPSCYFGGQPDEEGEPRKEKTVSYV